MIFTRNVELGKCKTRLAKTVGAEIALNIYTFLVKHTVAISASIEASRWVFYSDFKEKKDFFDNHIYRKFVQRGSNLGERMNHAFNSGFAQGYSKIIIIGSDIYDLNTEDLEMAFKQLEHHDYVLGPAQDGGYYLLGMKAPDSRLFADKSWGTETVLEETLQDLKGNDVKLLGLRNDVDIYDDIKNVAVFQKFLKGWNA